MPPARRLFVDSIPDDFDPDRDFALSPSCFIGRENVITDWDRIAFDDPLRDHDVQWRDWMRTRILANRLSRRMAKDLNEKHGTGYGERYWRELTILWLLLLIQSAWLRYLQITAAIERWGELPLEVPVAANVGEWKFRDDLEFFHKGPKNKDFDLWTATLFLRRHAPQNWTLTPARDVGYVPPDLPAQDTPPKSLSRAIVDALFPRRAVYNLTGGGKAEWLLSALVPFLPKREQRLSPTVDQTHADEKEAKFPDAFLADLDQLIERTIPETLTTEFRRYDGDAAKLPYKRGRIFVSGASKYVPATRFQTAHALEAGERLYRYQHGAFYGAAHIMIGHEIEYYDHGFISWGWREDGRMPKPAVALPAPKLSKLYNQHARKNDDIILVGTNIELGPYPFKPAPQQGDVLDYRRRKIRFMDRLSSTARGRLRYRPYANTYSDLEDLDFLRRHAGPVPEVTGPLDPHLLSCALAVVDHPSSVMYNSFAANVPTILTWDRAAWPAHRRGNDQYDILENAGIFHECPEAAAEKVSKIADDIDNWWQTDTVQTARRAWCDANAILKKNWFPAWVRALATVE